VDGQLHLSEEELNPSASRSFSVTGTGLGAPASRIDFQAEVADDELKSGIRRRVKMDGKVPMSPLPNFPLLFERVGVLLYRLRDLAAHRAHMTPEQVAAKLNELFEAHSPSELDNAINDYEEIVKTIYPASYGAGCPSGNPRIKA
jgi:hypothetical protein